MKRFLILIILYLLSSFYLRAQGQYKSYQKPDSVKVDADRLIRNTKQYLYQRIKRLARYERIESRKQMKLLNKLNRQEAILSKKILLADSTHTVDLTRTLPIDSIKALVKNKKVIQSGKKVKNEMQSAIDSLKRIKTFAEKSLSTIKNTIGEENEELDKLQSLEQKLNYNQYVNSLIRERTNDLSINCKGFGLGSSLNGITKQTYYYNQQLKAYRNMARDPGILEEKALNWLKGIQGFDEAVDANSIANLNTGSSQGMHSAQSVEDLEKMGFQTKRQVQKGMSQQLGANTNVQGMASQWRTRVESAQKQLTEAKNLKSKLKEEYKKLGFKPNSMKGMPLKLRLEKSLNWQVYRANGNKPAMFELNGLIGFRHTDALTYNLVFGGVLGLGTSFRDIRLSFEGGRVGLNSDLKWQYGFSVQAGYERVFKEYENTVLKLNENGIPIQTYKVTKFYYDLAYTGIQKSYKINSKYSGTILIAYDWLWRSGNSRTPIVWRFGWKK